MLSALAPFPLVAAPVRWDDPFSELELFESPFSLAPSLAALTRSLAGLPESLRSVARIEAGKDAALKVIFDELDDLDQVDVSVDEQTKIITIKAQNAAGTLRQSRAVMLPCDVQSCHKITAEHIGNRIVVTVPEESQVKPHAGQELSTPLKITLRPAEVEQPTPEFEVHEDDAGFTITVHGVAPEGANVKVQGKMVWVHCKAEGSRTSFGRAFELPRNAVDASEITAKITEDRSVSCSFKQCLVVSVPKDALEPERKTIKQKITVQKAVAASA
ncbi:hypothetical protein T492DRAFT_836159 [Pavlovales sp. CCMP2436]|nr:hypothetical protein T492DRAFT_836159 [Pavlovales sp. CCMP2436]